MLNSRCETCLHYNQYHEIVQADSEGYEYQPMGYGVCEITELRVESGDICPDWELDAELAYHKCGSCRHFHSKGNHCGTCGLYAWTTDDRCWCDDWHEVEPD